MQKVCRNFRASGAIAVNFLFTSLIHVSIITKFTSVELYSGTKRALIFFELLKYNSVINSFLGVRPSDRRAFSI